MTHDLWAGLNKHIHSYLAQISLSQLIAGKRDSKVIVHDRRGERHERPPGIDR